MFRSMIAAACRREGGGVVRRRGAGSAFSAAGVQLGGGVAPSSSSRTTRGRRIMSSSSSSKAKGPCGLPLAKCAHPATCTEGGKKVAGAGAAHAAEGDSQHHPCWNCGHKHECSSELALQDLMCACGAVQPVDGTRVNFYELFGCPMGVAIDGAGLEKRFLALQRKLHPDKFAQEGPEHLDMSSRTSAVVNDAYQVLRNPVSRVRYLLKLLGVNELEEESRMIVPPEILAEVYDVRERLEESHSREETEKILVENRRAMDAILASLQEAFKKRDLERLIKGAVRLQYLAKIQEEAQRITFALEDAAAG